MGEVWRECEFIFSSFQYSLSVKMSETMTVWTTSKSLTAVNCSLECEWKALCRTLCCFLLINTICSGILGIETRECYLCYLFMVLVKITHLIRRYYSILLKFYALCNIYIYVSDNLLAKHSSNSDPTPLCISLLIILFILTAVSLLW